MEELIFIRLIGNSETFFWEPTPHLHLTRLVLESLKVGRTFSSYDPSKPNEIKLLSCSLPYLYKLTFPFLPFLFLCLHP